MFNDDQPDTAPYANPTLAATPGDDALTEPETSGIAMDGTTHPTTRSSVLSDDIAHAAEPAIADSGDVQSNPADTTRLLDLNAAIDSYPDEPVNYIVRGELFLQRRQYPLAQADFIRGYQLAQARLQTSNWGIVLHALLDRARNGLEQTQKHMPD